MFKTYEKYIIKNFLNKFLTISLIFFSLIIILSILEEISFFKKVEINFLTPYLITLLSAPITLFEIFPFIFLLSTQFLFYDLFKKDELNLLKANGLSNIKIIKILSYSSFLIGIFTVLIFYNIASKLKFFYTDIKNNYSDDKRYLAVVTDSGLWLKDEVDEDTLIIKANNINDDYLVKVIINIFDSNFNLKKTIQSDKINISNNLWKIQDPDITEKNITKKNSETIILQTNFDKEKINSLFSNISTLNLLELFNLKKDYENLGYSSNEIKIHLMSILSTPILYSLLTILSAIIMFNMSKNRSLFFHIIFGVLMSVIIYYMNFIFNSLGNNGKISAITSIFMPFLCISIIAIIGLVKVNEK
jgi:lipopolysaccharide export system permease protein